MIITIKINIIKNYFLYLFHNQICKYYEKQLLLYTSFLTMNKMI